MGEPISEVSVNSSGWLGYARNILHWGSRFPIGAAWLRSRNKRDSSHSSISLVCIAILNGRGTRSHDSFDSVDCAIHIHPSARIRSARLTARAGR